MILDLLRDKCGDFFFPQIAISLLTLAVLLGYVVEWLRGGLRGPDRPWVRSLEPLAGISVTVGMLGSVVGVMRALQISRDDVQGIAGEIGLAFGTTCVGLTSSLCAIFGAWILGLIHREAQPCTRPR